MVGMMGSGKTAIGSVVAKKLGVAFLDSDFEIEKAADRSIAEIFERDGEPFFRKKETQVIARLLDESPCILSTGGGAYLSEENRTKIHAAGVAVWLKADVALLWARVRGKNTRPLLQTSNPKATLIKLCEMREPSYSQAELHVAAKAEYSIDEMAEAVIAELSKHPLILEGP